MYRASAIVCAVAACGLLGWAAYSAYTAADDDSSVMGGEGSLVVENAEQDLGELPVGEHVVVFRVINQSGQPAEVVGDPGQCGPGCCFFLREPDRVLVPPGGTVEVAGNLEVRRPEPFKFEGDLFLNDGGRLRTVRLKLTGVGVPARGQHATPP
jgi:hypothetical protein